MSRHDDLPEPVGEGDSHTVPSGPRTHDPEDAVHPSYGVGTVSLEGSAVVTRGPHCGQGC
jgi:hypothetical protein